MARTSQQKCYYYADGRRVTLTPDREWFAVDTQRVPDGAPATVQAEVQHTAQLLDARMQLVSRTALSPATTTFLQQVGALNPVFRAAGALLIALPEVWIEEHRPAQQQRLQEWLALHPGEARICSQNARGMVLAPPSGQGVDAVMLANRLTEEVAPEMVQANFLRVVPRPSVLPATAAHDPVLALTR